MVAVQNYHGNPAPPGKPVLTFQIGDVIELLRGDPDSPWWEVRALPSESCWHVLSHCHLHCPFVTSSVARGWAARCLGAALGFVLIHTLLLCAPC